MQNVTTRPAPFRVLPEMRQTGPLGLGTDIGRLEVETKVTNLVAVAAPPEAKAIRLPIREAR